MRVAIFSTHPTWLTHFETELEIAQDLLNKGANVDFYICDDKSFSCCENILSRSLLDKIKYNKISELNCNFCISRQSKGFNLLKGDIRKYPLINKKQIVLSHNFECSYLQSPNNLKNLYYDDDYDIGWSLLSSFVSFTRNPYIDLFEYKNEIQNLYSDSIKVYETAKEALISNNYDRIYVFNGRFSYTRGLLRLGQKYNVPTFIHERGSVPQKYGIFLNTYPHDISNYFKIVNKHWDKSNKIKRVIEGKNFFRNKIDGFTGSWKSYTSNFELDKLPEGFDTGLFNIVIFTSSDDEYISIDKTWDNPYFNNQLEGLEFLCEEFDKLGQINQILYIRLHPNSKEMDENYIKRLSLLTKYKNVNIIFSDSSVNSYSLLFNADKVITFGSTMTIEANFWGKPVVLLGNSLYSPFASSVKPEGINDVVEVCFKSKLTKTNRKDAIKIGYYLGTYGEYYKYYKAKDYLNGYFKGINLSTGELLISPEPKFTTFVNRIKRILYPCYLLFKKVI